MTNDNNPTMESYSFNPLNGVMNTDAGCEFLIDLFAQMKRIGQQSLKHTFASIADDTGLDEKTIRAICATTSMRLQTHSNPNAQFIEYDIVDAR